MTPDQLPDSLQLRNLVRSLATLDLLIAPSQPSITFQAGDDPHTQSATLRSENSSTWTLLFTQDGATLSLEERRLTVASTVEHPQWESSSEQVNIPDILSGTPEKVQEWFAIQYAIRPDPVPLRQILMSVPLTVDLARDLGNARPWPELREAISRIGYPIPDEDLPGPDNATAGANLD